MSNPEKEKMISPLVQRAMKDKRYSWSIKLESRTPGEFLIEKSFKGTFDEARLEGDRLAARLPLSVKRILLHRHNEVES